MDFTSCYVHRRIEVSLFTEEGLKQEHEDSFGLFIRYHYRRVSDQIMVYGQ